MNNNGFMEKACELVRQYSGKAGFFIKSADGKEEYVYRQDEIFSSASVVKIFILGTFLKQVEENKVSLNQMLTLKESEKVDGSGILLNMSEGLTLCVKDVAMLMIILSDNTATNMLIDYVGGIEKVWEHLKEAGIRHSKVNRKIADNPQIVSKCPFGEASARELVEYVDAVCRGRILKEEGQTMFLDILEHQHYKNLFTRFMPLTDYYEEEMPKQVKVANKTGFMDGIRTDVGIIETETGKQYIYAVLTNDCSDTSYAPDGEADLFPALLGKLFYECVWKEE